ncbi:MAG: TerC/Alx family metal homeostasis membrane protein [Pseudomonadota bacterium]
MDFFATYVLGAPLWIWSAFFAVVLGVLVLDLGILNRQAKPVTLSRSIAMTCFITSLAFLFAGWIYNELGLAKAQLFVTALLLEQSLSIDNVFVMAMVFAYFGIPPAYQHRVLFWGILLAMLLRAVFIGFGTALVITFDWMLWLFAAFLIYSGYKMFMEAEMEPDIGNNPVVRFLCRNFRVTTEMDGDRFFLRKPLDGTATSALYATPVFLCFLTINFADIIFAVDSVPAVLSLTQDPFIVYTSNIFAILGLRSLYFVINALIARFHYLEHALSVLLVFIGGKIIWDHIVSPLDPGMTLGITVAIIVIAIIASIFYKYEERRKMPR